MNLKVIRGDGKTERLPSEVTRLSIKRNKEDTKV